MTSRTQRMFNRAVVEHGMARIAEENAEIAAAAAQRETELAAHIKRFAASLSLNVTDTEFDAAINAELARWREANR